MGWMQKLCEVYDASISTTATAEETPLLPVGWIEKKIKFQLTLSPQGDFVTAHILPEGEQLYSIPSLPSAENRVGNAAPYPLAEQVQFLSEEFNPQFFAAYLKNLTQWSQAPNAPACLQTLLQYLGEKTLLQDLRSVMPEKWDPKKDEKSFLTFAILDDAEEKRLLLRPEVQESWTSYYAQQQFGDCDICYVTGRHVPIMEKHPKLEGNAKLISAEESTFRFLYKGRFSEDRSAVKIGVTSSIKAHNALRWLIARQGLRRYGMTSVAWNVGGVKLSPPLSEEDAFFGTDIEETSAPDTMEEYAKALEGAAKSYGEQFLSYQRTASAPYQKRMDEVCILSMEAATNGRMSITYYQELPGNDYVARLKKWYRECCWYLPNKKGIATPGFYQLASAILGQDQLKLAGGDFKCDKAATKAVRELSLRILMCTTQQKPLPKPYVERAIHRSLSPLSFTDDKGSWQRFGWQRSLAVTCAMLRKCRIDEDKGELSPVLDYQNHDRSYLYGRLLAVADKLEQDASDATGLPTNAIRMLNFLAQRPTEGWMQLHNKLLPYIKRLGRDGHRANGYQLLIGEIERSFDAGDRVDPSPLNALFLVGYDVQSRELWQSADKRQAKPAPPAFCLPNGRDELFGALLALADVVQRTAQGAESCDGATNALLLMPMLSVTPNSGWAMLHDKLVPYLEKLGQSKARDYQRLIGQVEARFDLSERSSEVPLNSGYLRGYYALRSGLLLQDKEVFAWRDKPECLPEPESREAIYGALLAKENAIERFVLDRIQRLEDRENRPSNTMRFLTQAAVRPNEVWSYLEQRLKPYGKKLYCTKPMDELEELKAILQNKQFDNNQPLGGEYLHYFYIYLTNLRRK